MFRVPIPRRSFLDSPLRTRSHENRQLAANGPVGESHLGHGPRAPRVRTSAPRTAPRARA